MAVHVRDRDRDRGRSRGRTVVNSRTCMNILRCRGSIQLLALYLVQNFYSFFSMFVAEAVGRVGGFVVSSLRYSSLRSFQNRASIASAALGSSR